MTMARILSTPRVNKVMEVTAIHFSIKALIHLDTEGVEGSISSLILDRSLLADHTSTSNAEFLARFIISHYLLRYSLLPHKDHRVQQNLISCLTDPIRCPFCDSRIFREHVAYYR